MFTVVARATNALHKVHEEDKDQRGIQTHAVAHCLHRENPIERAANGTGGQHSAVERFAEA